MVLKPCDSVCEPAFTNYPSTFDKPQFANIYPPSNFAWSQRSIKHTDEGENDASNNSDGDDADK